MLQTLPDYCTVCVTHGQQFIFLWDEDREIALRRQLGLMATNPRLDFDWRDVVAVQESMNRQKRYRNRL
jgi:hypothetical protein